MATDATGTPTAKGIPKFNTAVDAPSGKGFNAAMDQIDTELGKSQWTTDTPVTNEFLSYTGSAYAFGGLATSYVPVWTAVGTDPTLGDGTIEGIYVRHGGLIVVSITLTIGSTTTFGTGAWEFSYPSIGGPDVAQGQGVGTIIDISVPTRYAIHARAQASVITLMESATSPAGEIGVGVPITWAAGDSLRFTVPYFRNA